MTGWTIRDFGFKTGKGTSNLVVRSTKAVVICGCLIDKRGFRGREISSSFLRLLSATESPSPETDFEESPLGSSLEVRNPDLKFIKVDRDLVVDFSLVWLPQGEEIDVVNDDSNVGGANLRFFCGG